MKYVLLLLIVSSHLTAGLEKRALLNYDQLVSTLGLKITDKAEQEDNQLLHINNASIIEQLINQLHLKNIDTISAYIAKVPIAFKQKIDLMYQILSDFGFSYNDMARLILSVANEYGTSSEQLDIMNMLLEFPILFEKTNPLFIALSYNYTRVIPLLTKWVEQAIERKPALRDALASMKDRALQSAVTGNNIDIMNKVHAMLGSLSSAQATDLVWSAIQNAQNKQILLKLKQYGADLDTLREGKTPLINAVIQKNKQAVQALIDAGANVNALGGLEVGSPLQQAIAQGDVAIENILRNAGAHE